MVETLTYSGNFRFYERCQLPLQPALNIVKEYWCKKLDGNTVWTEETPPDSLQPYYDELRRVTGLLRVEGTYLAKKSQEPVIVYGCGDIQHHTDDIGVSRMLFLGAEEEAGGTLVVDGDSNWLTAGDIISFDSRAEHSWACLGSWAFLAIDLY